MIRTAVAGLSYAGINEPKCGGCAQFFVGCLSEAKLDIFRVSLFFFFEWDFCNIWQHKFARTIHRSVTTVAVFFGRMCRYFLTNIGDIFTRYFHVPLIHECKSGPPLLTLALDFLFLAFLFILCFSSTSGFRRFSKKHVFLAFARVCVCVCVSALY